MNCILSVPARRPHHTDLWHRSASTMTPCVPSSAPREFVSAMFSAQSCLSQALVRARMCVETIDVTGRSHNITPLALGYIFGDEPGLRNSYFCLVMLLLFMLPGRVVVVVVVGVVVVSWLLFEVVLSSITIGTTAAVVTGYYRTRHKGKIKTQRIP